MDFEFDPEKSAINKAKHGIDFTMRMRFYDAHAHLPNLESGNYQTSNQASSDSSERTYSVINGTSPDDWPAVLEFTRGDSRKLSAIGLHPQNVEKVSEGWKETLLQFLADNPECSIGEIGLDRRYQSNDFAKQLDAFFWQLQQAHNRNQPVSIHCVKAIGMLMETLRTHVLPSRGIHLHAYAGPVELVSELVEMGAYFSFSARQLELNNAKVRDRMRAIPMNRLLIETDKAHTEDASGLHNCYVTIAEMRGILVDQLAACIEENFKRYFLAC